MPQGSIPPYLTSGAFSRAHHAFVVKLDQATTVQAIDAVVDAEVQRVRAELDSGSLSTVKISQALLVLLHCALVRQHPTADLDFALVHAFKLAEGGKLLKERRIGYLYVCERLPLGHELTLLFINTIRKDLSSTSPAHILLATTAISSIPSPDLAPAVLPQLTSRTLLRHKLPAIRKAALHCLRVICANGPSNDTRASSSSSTLTAPATFSLPSERLGRLLSSERDPSVLSAILKCTLIAVKRDMTYCTPRSLWISAVLQAADYLPQAISQVKLDIIAVLELLLRDVPDGPDVSTVTTCVASQLARVKTLKGWDGAFVIRACALASTLKAQREHLINSILRVLTSVLSSSHSRKSQDALSSNDHCAVLKCLHLLPRDIVENRLSETEMAVIMGGLEHQDQTIRRQTLRLLSSIAPTLSDLTISRRLEQLKSDSRDLDLRLRQVIAARALEVATIDAEHSRDGRRFAKQVIEINAALDGSPDAVARSSYLLWEAGMTSILETVKHNDATFGTSFTSSLAESSMDQDEIGQTLSVILASVMCEYTPDLNCQKRVQLLLGLLAQSPGYVQEPLLIALVATVARDDGINEEVKASIHRAVEGIRSSSRKPLRTRCDQVLQVIDDGLLGLVREERKADTLIDWLQAIMQVLFTRRKAVSRTPSVQSPDARSPGPALSASSLRYDAYEVPVSPSRPERRMRRTDGPATGSMSRTITAGDLALAESSPLDRNDHAEELNDKLNLLDLQSQPSPKQATVSRRHRLAAVPDPFGDSDPEE